MTERLGIRELRDTLTATMRRVQTGTTIEITHHGRPVATLAPTADDRLQRLAQAGDVTPGEPLAHPLRRYPVTTAVTASRALEEDRAER
jgi:prevent-host-death family protein